MISDGHLHRILRMVATNSVVDLFKLKNFVENEFESQVKIQDVISTCKTRDFAIFSTDNSVKLSDKGNDWVIQNTSELSDVSRDDSENVEYDDQSTSEELDDALVTKPYQVSKLKMEAKVLSIFQALRKISKGEIKLNPDFQRAYVWDLEKQSRLIESVLIRIPLPAFYLDATNQLEWQVVDGLQRLTTLYRFCHTKEFKLKGLQFLKDLEGSSFDQLPKSFQILLEDDTSLQFYNLMPGTPIEAKYTIFSRVNTGGMQLTPQEIRHALNQGKITKVLERLAKEDIFIKATDGVVESKRMSDRELVLRALAFMEFDVDTYKEFGELDQFLLNMMSRFNKKTDEELNKLEQSFVNTVTFCYEVFGKYCFRKFYSIQGRRSPLNKALFEVWVATLYKLTAQQKKIILNKRQLLINNFVDLLNNDDAFLRSISSGTGSFSSVKNRFSKIEFITKKTLASK